MSDMTATPMETLLKRFQFFKPSTLKGTDNSAECESWLEDIEQLFESLDYADDCRVKLVVHQLHDVAKVSYRKEKGAEFASLQQRQLNIEEYVAKFMSLLKFSPHIAESDEAQADQFINGLNSDVFTLVNAGRPNNFADALNRAKGAEAGILRQRGAQFVPLPVTPSQDQPQIPPPLPRFEKGSGSSRKDFFRAKGKQFMKTGSRSSSSSGQRKFQSGQSFSYSGVYCNKCGGCHASDQCRGVFGTCHICNQTGHFARVCPQCGYGSSQGARSSRIVTQPERQASSVHSFQPDPPQNRAGGSNCSIFGYPAYVLVDTGASHTFISEQFTILHAFRIEPLATIVSISSPLGRDFDCIIDINLLTKYRATVDCFQKVVRFKPEMADEWKFYGKGSRARIPLISVLSMTHLLQKGAEGFLIYVVDMIKTSPKLVDFLVVSEFANVFPDEIPGLPPAREIDFSIELMPGDDISVDPSKVEAVISWPRPISIPEIRSFMGLAGYYRRFIQDFSSISKPITQLTRNNAPYIWTEVCEASFIELKKRLTTSPVLTIPSGNYEHLVEKRRN
ncbi:uncharacterized protein [Henckelia pumila]|uniref:uncharacterized protein n=1 Tax=Henckelia pumila TaxID=405737 RepID=UPI003C6E1C7F